MKEIGNGLYIESGYDSGNLGLIVTTQGAILIDTPMVPSEAQAWRDRVLARCPDGIAYLISTDYQGQRVLGNYFYEASLVMHENGWDELHSRGDSMLQRHINMYKKRAPQVATTLADVAIRLPEVAVADQLTLHQGERKIQIWHMPGHSPASLGIYIPDSRVLFAGDLVVSGQHPNLGDAVSQDWIATLESMLGMDIQMIVPGRGEPCDKEALPPLIAYIKEMRELVREYYEQGASRRDTVDKVRGKMLDRFTIAEGRKDFTARQIRGSVERVYEEIRKGQ